MEVGKALLFLGVLLVLLGLVLLYFPKLFSWFGHLPGDIRIEREGLRVYIPLTSALVLSLLLTLLWNLLGLLRR
ncbi:DUF2905 domain-containing protein [Thermus scotoductus]|jgi:hypothetical protein|uniref:DUF2905 domain-containing protein n=1 Tax=Thermus scotoductus TaxID=37636 RepID=A0A348XQ99_THESC|nr:MULTISPECIES: DUF2905 domain-containing protein [Thermus]ETN88903.1 hypothetical protein TNMX_04500 [Thermus sp. NMX2.A1]RTG95373.1 DUF2905 domain-containing protein [Thermus scotoductus]RTG96115.1 DUF2905 domain-containing protein [Thermus scotoductus]RTG96347.1 DUF2905 domain-containing protein [Thermus scotoductus]RTH02087.1 DUF2905 domain-containing protein [Thermus scotoductus]